MLKSLILSFALASTPMFAAADVQPSSMTIIGHGEFTTQPDMAKFTLRVVTNEKSAKEALLLNNARMKAVISMLADEGIEGELVRTTGISVDPMIEPISKSSIRWENQPRTVSGYFAKNSLSVRINDLERLGPVLDAVVGTGADMIGGIEFGLKDPAPAMAKARKLSVEDALAQASLYANAVDMDVEGISEITPLGMMQPTFAAPRYMSMDIAEQSVPVSEGEIPVSADVNITFRLAPRG